jgi:polyvinyl alcohol dehydrogenase (cytochrome)
MVFRQASNVTIPEASRPTKRNAAGTHLYGPSGAAVWSSPTVDVQRQALYVATGDNYSDPPSEASDAILAFELATGRMLWHWQATAKDSFITSCFVSTGPTVRKAMAPTTTLANRLSW